MIRCIVGFFLFLACAAIAPELATAVTIQEYPIEVGAAPGAHAPYYLKTGPDGNLWIVDRGTTGRGIQRMAPSGQQLIPIPTALPPQDIAVGASGAVYWTESASGATAGALALRSPGPDDIVTRTPDPGNDPSIDPFSVALSADEDVWVGSQAFAPGLGTNGNERVCTLADIAFVLGCNTVAAGTKSHTTSITVLPGGQAWAVASEENALHRLVRSAQAALGQPPMVDLDVPLPAGSGPLRSVLGPDGNLWVTMLLGNAIDRLNAAGGDRTRFELGPGRGPSDIAVGPDGALWFTEMDANAIGRITTSGQVLEFPVPTPGAQPNGITAGPDGAIWFTELGTGKVGRLQLDAPGIAGGPGGGGGVADTVAPRFTRGLTVSPSTFRAKAAARRSTPRGTSFRFSLSEAARVTITIARRRTGRRVGGSCVKSTRANRHRRRCTRYETVGTLRRDALQGPNSVAFSGRLNGRALHGAYRATAIARDPAGHVSRPSRRTFTVVRR